MSAGGDAGILLVNRNGSKDAITSATICEAVLDGDGKFNSGQSPKDARV
jgi:hypothetical protein